MNAKAIRMCTTLSNVFVYVCVCVYVNVDFYGTFGV